MRLDQSQTDFFRLIQRSLDVSAGVTHYNPKLGIGARTAHQFPDGTVKAICLTPADENFCQKEKEGLALVFAVTRFYWMLFGRHFTLETDHKPQLVIFGSKTGILIYIANRLQRRALTLLLYDFTIEYVSTDSFEYADLLSRLMKNDIRPDPDEKYVIVSIEVENTFQEIWSITYKSIQSGTSVDPVLQEVLQRLPKRPISPTPVNNTTYAKTDFQPYQAVLPIVSGWCFRPRSKRSTYNFCIQVIQVTR